MAQWHNGTEDVQTNETEIAANEKWEESARVTSTVTYHAHVDSVSGNHRIECAAMAEVNTAHAYNKQNWNK